ncbi:MAG: hypothetical protein WBX19_14420 [Terracidiphilus sp.]
MTCYSVTLLKILPDKAGHVVKALRREGLFAALKNEIPSHIGCSILEAEYTNDLYLVIDFWRSKYDFFESEISPTGIFLSDVLHRMAYQHATLGPFTFPPPDRSTEDFASEPTMTVESPVEVDAGEFVRE